MTRETYHRMTENLKEQPETVQRIRRMNQLLTAIVFCVYPLFLVVLFLEKDDFLIRAVLVPAISFVVVSIFRRILNVKRPYEKYGIEPVIEKDTKGKSFPSRHVFSVFIIAATIFCYHPGAGVLLGIIGVILGIMRVMGGVHEPVDVIAGALIGIGCAWIGYVII